ncbi:MAG: OmpA family protein [bacterium]|nr:OmpA family protein [bacterium]
MISFNGHSRQEAKGEKGFRYIDSSPLEIGQDPAREVGVSNWVFSYADMMTSMVVFLLMLLSFSTISYQKLKQVSEATSEIMHDKNTPSQQALATPIEKFETELTQFIQEKNLQSEVALKMEGEGAVLTIGESVLFESGHARLTDGTKEKLKPLFESLKELPSDYRFTVEGHTDDNPIHTFEYASNWELSAARGLAVVLLMKELGFSESRLSFQSFGEQQPILPNRDPEGRSLPTNQEKNRRAVIKIQQQKP